MRTARTRRAPDPRGWLGVAGGLAVALASVTSSASAQVGLPRAAPSEAGLSSATLDEIGRVVEAFVTEERIAGAVVGVARHGRMAYLETFGVQDLETGVPMSETSIFRIYSMAKAVTAVGAMILHEEGHYELDDPVAEYIPGFAEVRVLQEDGTTRPPARPITIRDLYLHTDGLSHRNAREYREENVRSRSIGLPELMDNIVAVPLREDPGERFRYGISPTVLGHLIEIWSGQPFDDFLHERVLSPLRMDDTGFWVAPEDRRRFASVYRIEETGPLRPHRIEDVPWTERPALLEGSVGLVSTVPDFLRFGQMLLNGGELDGVRLLSEEVTRSMTTNELPPEILAQRRGGSGWALANVSVVVDPAEAGEGINAGEFRWDGSAGTEFVVDPVAGTVLVTAWQSAPANPERLRQRIRALVREAVIR